MKIDKNRLVGRLNEIAFDPEGKPSDSLHAISMLMEISKEDSAEDETLEKLKIILNKLEEKSEEYAFKR